MGKGVTLPMLLALVFILMNKDALTNIRTKLQSKATGGTWKTS